MMTLWTFVAALTASGIGLAFLVTRRKPTLRDDTLIKIGSTLVVLGILFGDGLVIGYSFIGTGVLLSIFSKLKSKKGWHIWRRTP